MRIRLEMINFIIYFSVMEHPYETKWDSRKVFKRMRFCLEFLNTAQRMFVIMDFFSKCDQIRCFPWIWSDLLKKPFMENFIFCAVKIWQPC